MTVHHTQPIIFKRGKQWSTSGKQTLNTSESEDNNGYCINKKRQNCQATEMECLNITAISIKSSILSQQLSCKRSFKLILKKEKFGKNGKNRKKEAEDRDAIRTGHSKENMKNKRKRKQNGQKGKKSQNIYYAKLNNQHYKWIILNIAFQNFVSKEIAKHIYSIN